MHNLLHFNFSIFQNEKTLPLELFLFLVWLFSFLISFKLDALMLFCWYFEPPLGVVLSDSLLLLLLLLVFLSLLEERLLFLLFLELLGVPVKYKCSR